MSNNLQSRNRIVALSVLGVVCIMTGMAFAAVPLYDLFCRVTGFGGTTQVAQAAPGQVGERVITVQFNADTAPDLRWTFEPEQRSIDIPVGQKGLASYRAKNLLAQPLAGTAVYNVSPPKAGKYFHKIECFCFSEQVLEPGQDVSMPVVFFIDPSIQNDKSMKDVSTITLSYTFFKTRSAGLDKALEDFYNQTPDQGSTAF